MSIWCWDDWDISPDDIAPQEVAVYEQVIASLEPVLTIYKQYLARDKELTLEDFYNVAKDSKQTAELFATRDDWSSEDAEEIAEINGWSDVTERFAEWKLRILDVEQEITKYKIKLVWAKLCSIAFQRDSLGYHDYTYSTSMDYHHRREFEERKKRHDDYIKELTDLENQLEQLISQYAEYDVRLLSEFDKQRFTAY